MLSIGNRETASGGYCSSPKKKQAQMMGLLTVR
jgi:hypothetical protein